MKKLFPLLLFPFQALADPNPGDSGSTKLILFKPMLEVASREAKKGSGLLVFNRRTLLAAVFAAVCPTDSNHAI